MLTVYYILIIITINTLINCISTQARGTSLGDSLNFYARQCYRENWLFFKIFCPQLPPPSETCQVPNDHTLNIYTASLPDNNKLSVLYYPYHHDLNEMFSYEETKKVIRSYQFKTHLLTIDDQGYVIIAPENAELVNQTWSLVAV